jgi:hypothetical protein
MRGASEQTRRVTILNANWIPDPDGDDGRFEIMIVTEGDEQHTVATTAASAAAIVPLAQANTVLMWDPTNRTLIAANVIGEMPWPKNL